MAEEDLNSKDAGEEGGGLEDMIGTAVTGIAKIGENIVGILTKISGLIIESSPYLQGVLKLIDRMFKLVLMPVGNMIAKMLLPLAIKMANNTMKVMQQFANAGPDQMADAASAGFSVIFDSMAGMMSTILTKALGPLFNGLIQGLISGIATYFQTSSSDASYSQSTTQDLKDILGTSAAGTANIIGQFGSAVITNTSKAIGASAGDLATVLYSGSTSIADGFQSTDKVIAAGTTNALNSLKQYNVANAGLYTVVDTTTVKFTTLNESLDQFTKIMDAINKNNKTSTTTSGGGGGGWDWVNIAEAVSSAVIGGVASVYLSPQIGIPLGLGLYGAERGMSMASGGVIRAPTHVLAGENGPERIEPLTGSNSSRGTTINVHMYGDYYGDDDFDKKVGKVVGKYSKNTRGAY